MKRLTFVFLVSMIFFGVDIGFGASKITVTVGDAPGNSEAISESDFSSYIGSSMFSNVSGYSYSAPSSDSVRLDMNNGMAYSYPTNYRDGNAISFSQGSPYWVDNWNTHLVFYNGNDVYKFPEVQVGDKIRIYCKNTGWQAAAYIKSPSYEQAFPSLVAGSDAFYIGGRSYFDVTITQDMLSQMQSYGLCIGGFCYSITGVYIMKGSASNTYTYTQTGTTWIDWNNSSYPAIDVSYNDLKGRLDDIAAGDVITVKIKGNTDYGTPKLQVYTNNGNGLYYIIGGSTGKEVGSGEATYSYTVESNTVADYIKNRGISVNGYKIDFESATLTKASLNSYYRAPASVSYTKNSDASATDWNMNLAIIPASEFTSAKVGDAITVNISTISSGVAQGKMSCAGQSLTRHLVPISSGGYITGTFDDTYSTSTSFTGYIGNSTMLHILQSQGLTLEGKNYTINGVTLGHTIYINDLLGGNTTFSLRIPAYTADKWYGFVLPYDITDTNDILNLFGISDISKLDIDVLSSVTYTMKNDSIKYRIGFSPASKYIQANVPYIICLGETVGSHDYTFTDDTWTSCSSAPVIYTGVDDKASGYSVVFRGLDKEYTNITGNSYYFSSGKLYRASSSGGTNIKGGRSYIQMTGGNGAKMYLASLGDDTSTGMVTVERDVPSGNYHSSVMYNMNGQRINTAYKGIVIKNGKKCINK